MVPYPDDPRVVNGEWSLTVLGRESGIQRMVYAAGSQRLFLLRNDNVVVFDYDAATGWVEVERALATNVNLATYDPTLETFVSIRSESGRLRITTVPADGTSTTSLLVDLPEGHTLESTARGSGNSFAFTRNVSGALHLTWWNSLTGERGGSRSVPAAPDGVRVSRNGRLLALWNMTSWHVMLIDTAAPQTNKRVRLGACRTNARIEGSDDGRWALVKGCNDSWQLSDLSAPDPGLSPIGVTRTDTIGFAAGSSEIVWLDRQGAVNALEPVSRTRTELLRLDDRELFDDFNLWYMHLHVDRAAGLLAVSTARGAVRVEPLDDAVHLPGLSAEMPSLLLDGATLDVRAHGLSEPSYAYDFSGTIALIGPEVLGSVLPIEGMVYAHDLHEYRPGLAPAAYIPRLAGRATVVDPDTGEELLTLTFETRSYTETVYDGYLIDLLTDDWYRVRLQRVDGAAP